MATKIITNNGDFFEIVENAPLGYEIWNIGENIVDGYLPFCRIAKNQTFAGGRNIETDTLKAVKCDGAQIILDAISSGIDTIPKMEKYIVRYKNAKPGSYAHARVQKIKKALPFMREIFKTK